MQPLSGPDGKRHAAPKTVLATSYHGRTHGLNRPITIPAGTEVRQTPAGANFGYMEALIDHVWIQVAASSPELERQVEETVKPHEVPKVPSQQETDIAVLRSEVQQLRSDVQKLSQALWELSKDLRRVQPDEPRREPSREWDQNP